MRAFAVAVLTVLLCFGLAVVLEPAASSAAPPVTGCAWSIQTGNGGGDGYDADLDASYWVTSFLATQGAGVIVNGSFPDARYMSISAYNASGPPSGVHFYDAEIQPATGSNRFQTGVSTSAAGTYQVQIVAQTAPADPASNTLYVGQNNALVYIMYRVYDADNASDPTGGVGLPQVSSTYQGTVTATHGGCVVASQNAPRSRPGLPSAGAARPPKADAGLRPRGSRLALGSRATEPTTEPTWTVANVTRFPNADASYLKAPINYSPGQIAVFAAAMPTFADTNIGVSPAAPSQVRYWSMCEEGASTLVVAGCLADYAVVQSGGVATFVISTAADRPTNATTANGINWIPLGSSAAELIVYRQLLADPAFTQSIGAVPADEQASTVMGPYYPQIAYCSVAAFESEGAACRFPMAIPIGSGDGGPSSPVPGFGSGAPTLPPRCVVPNLHHMTLAQGRRRLARAHCRLGKVGAPKHVRPHQVLRVTGQSAKRGSKHLASYRVNLRLQ